MKTLRIRKWFRFEASHKLPNHDGKCARLHGHSWEMGVEIQASAAEIKSSGPKAGMLVDFGDVSRVVKPFVDSFLDHYHLNDTTGLENPTSEELARWVFNRLKPNIGNLKAITIKETCTSECTYEDA